MEKKGGDERSGLGKKKGKKKEKKGKKGKDRRR